jgi:hypothetical protein
MAQMRKSAAKNPKGAPKQTVKVSPNVTVRSPKTGRGTISGPEQARLKAINAPVKTSKKDVKRSAKALKESGKVKPKTDTQMKRYLPNSFETETKTARELAREAAAKRAAAAKRGPSTTPGGWRGGGMGSSGGPFGKIR